MVFTRAHFYASQVQRAHVSAWKSADYRDPFYVNLGELKVAPKNLCQLSCCIDFESAVCLM